ncbi:MAG TPA: TonB-dependent receptor, partial [Longimicrobiales bacterium]
GAQANWGRDYESHRSGYEAPPEEPALISESEWEHEAIALLAESRYDYRGRFSAEVGLRSDWSQMPFFAWWRRPSSSDRDHLVSYRAGVTYLAYDGEASRASLPGVDAVRLRAAYGAAERVPRVGAFPAWMESLRVVEPPPPPPEEVVIRVIEPWLVGEERLAEAELGVELDLLGGRIGLAASAFRRTTRDGDQFAANPYQERRVLYRLQNQGLELVADADILRGRNVAWTARAVVTHLANKAIETGDTPWLYHLWNEVREGSPAHGFFVRRIIDVDTVAGRAIVADEREFAGSIIPSWEAALDTEVTLWRRLRLRALLDGRSGFHILNDTELTRDQKANNSERAVRRDELPAAERLRYFGPYVGSNGGPVLPSDVVGDYVQDGTFLRVRELAATLELPRVWAARIGASVASLTLAGRNVALWSRYGGIDPEVPALSTPTLSRIDLFAVPQATRWIGRLTLQF